MARGVGKDEAKNAPPSVRPEAKSAPPRRATSYERHVARWLGPDVVEVIFATDDESLGLEIGCRGADGAAVVVAVDQAERNLSTFGPSFATRRRCQQSKSLQT